MKVEDFDFDLPAEFIAQRPAAPRHAARLFVANGLVDRTMRDLPQELKAGDILVFNDTRVIPARLRGKRGEANVEVTLHKRENADTWKVFARPAKKLKPGNRIDFADAFSAEVIEKGTGGEVMLKFDRSGGELMTALETHGGMPLPPYIKREGLADARDKADYQTLFAEKKGAVAAPTAGLHFTPELMAALDARGLQHVTVTLHVGAGTFLPVKVANTDDHVMHAEWGEVGAETARILNATKQAGGRIVCVGTTSLRLLESAADESGMLHPFSDETDIFITPGYRFRFVDVLLTNFHLPKSTLFMLIAAFAGLENMKKLYKEAMNRGYRFYSYGDGCLLEKDERL